jgi:hypothetical protein
MVKVLLFLFISYLFVKICWELIFKYMFQHVMARIVADMHQKNSATPFSGFYHQFNYGNQVTTEPSQPGSLDIIVIEQQSDETSSGNKKRVIDVEYDVLTDGDTKT